MVLSPGRKQWDLGGEREVVSTPDALLKRISAILGPISKEVTEEKPGSCVGQCEHVDVDLGRTEAFPDAAALYDERIYANGVGRLEAVP